MPLSHCAGSNYALVVVVVVCIGSYKVVLPKVYGRVVPTG